MRMRSHKMNASAAVPFALTCLLYAIPGGPPRIKYEDAVLQVFPVDKTKCPEINPLTDVTFQLYTKNNPTEALPLLIGDDAGLIRTEIDFTLPTMMFFHAFFEDSITPTAQAIKQGYLQHGGYNLIFVNAPRLLAGPWFLTASRNTAVIGRYAAEFIDYLVSRGLQLSTLHLVGLSLGAQVAGVCGHFIRSGRPARITGLDPAEPSFTKVPNSLKLDKSDAEFVDIIHTDAGVFGYSRPMGHADFWPNSGRSTQPGCTYAEIGKRNPGSIFEPLFCSHWRSYQYYAESINKPRSFAAIKCKSWRDFQRQVCDSNEIVPMGLATPSYARGNYYLATNVRSPYSQT